MFNHRVIAVVLPAYNEASFIPYTLKHLPSYLDYVIVVNDGSTDATRHKVLEVNRLNLTILDHPNRRGVGQALKSGFKRALQLPVDFIVTMDADGQMDPRDLPLILEPLVRNHADFVKGNRFHTKSTLWKMPFMRYCGNRFFSLLQSLALGQFLVQDSQCGFTAISRVLLERIDLSRLWPQYGVYNDLLFQAVSLKARVVNVGVRTIYGHERSDVRFWDALRIFRILFNQWKTRVACR